MTNKERDKIIEELDTIWKLVDEIDRLRKKSAQHLLNIGIILKKYPALASDADDEKR